MKNIILSPSCADEQFDSCDVGTNQLMVTEGYNESFFDVYYHREWFANNWYFSIYASILYMICISSGQKWMKNRKPFDLKSIMFTWNLMLSCFSLLGSTKLIPELLSAVLQKGYYYSVCNNSFKSDINYELSIWLFTWSKFIEFGDTVFIILKKQKLLFLHWIHHVITLIYCFFVYSEVPAISRWGITINYTMHSIMYFYYALKTLKYSIPTKISMTITIMQTIQMIVGMALGLSVCYFIIQGFPCDGSLSTSLATFFMSCFYFILFAIFFVKRYLITGKQSND